MEDNYDDIPVAHITAMKEISKKIPLTMIKALNQKQKVQKLMTEIGGGWYMEKSAKGLPLLRISTLSKKPQDKEDEIKKNYEANKWWNDWKLKLHWNKLEWVNPRSQTKSDKPFSVSSRSFYLNKGDITSNWVGHSKIK